MEAKTVDKAEHTGIKKSYPCTYEGCKAVFNKPSKLQYHTRRHTGERPFVCDEPNCNKKYFYSFHLRRHKETHVNKCKQKRLVCPHKDCFLELANVYSLRKHIKRKHSKRYDYAVTCNVCHLGFFKKKQLLQHSYVHTGVLPFKCKKCDTRFPAVRELNRHMRTHSTYNCTCGDTFERWTHLLKHRKICGKISYICNICDRPFNKADNLQRHLKLHQADSSQKFFCGHDNCLRVYQHKKNLIYHINCYHNHKPKQRLYCGHLDCTQSFTRKQTLKLHIERVHINTKAMVKKERKPRKDKGSHRMDVAATLAGFDLPLSNNSVVKEKDISPVASEISEILAKCIRNCLKKYSVQ